MATPTVKLRVLAASWRRRYKDEDKEVCTDRYVRGDEVEVSEREAKKLLRENSAKRVNFAKSGSEDDPFRDGAEDSDDEPKLSHEEEVNTTQEGKPAGSSMPRSAPAAPAAKKA